MCNNGKRSTMDIIEEINQIRNKENIVSLDIGDTVNKPTIQSNKDFKNKMQEYDEGLHHDFIALFLGVFGNDHFNSRFFLFFVSIYADMVNENKSNQDGEDSKGRFTIHKKKQLFLNKLDNKDFLIISFKKWLDCGYSNFEEKDKEIKEFKKFVFHYNQYNWIEEEQAYHITNPIRDKIKEAVLFLYPDYDNKYGEKYFFSIFNNCHLFSYDIYHDGNSEHNFFLYKNFHCYTINEVVGLYQKANMLPSLLNTFHSIQVKQNNNSNQYQTKRNYIPHLIYCEMKEVIFYLHIYQCTNDQIHELYDDFCGIQLIDDILQEAKKYSLALNQHEIDYFSFEKNLLMFQLDSDSSLLRKPFLTKKDVDKILKNRDDHNEEHVYLGYLNVNKLNDIFDKIESKDLKHDYFNLLGTILKNNDFTILKPYYCFKIEHESFVIKPFSQYQENELKDLKYNNPAFIAFDWINHNHPNTLLKSYVHQYILLKELTESNMPYYKIWQTMVAANQYCNFYQVGKPIYFGIEHLKNKTHDQLNDFIQYCLRYKENNVSIYEYSDINIPMFNKFLDARSSEIKENNHIVKNIFHPRNLMFLDKKTSNLNIDTMLNFKEVYQHLLSEIQRYHKDNSYYIKPIFLKIQQHGLGVTHFLQEFSKDMLLGLESVDVSTLSTYGTLIGLSSVWSNGVTGLIYNLSQQYKSKLALLCLDNFDKLGGKLDKGQNSLEKDPIDVIKRLILKKSRLNYVDDYDVTKFVNINHLITICVGEHIPNIYSNDIVNSFNVFNITPYKMDNPIQPNPIFANIWKDIMQD